MHGKNAGLLSLHMPAHPVSDDEKAQWEGGLSLLCEYKLQGEAGVLIANPDAPRV